MRRCDILQHITPSIRRVMPRVTLLECSWCLSSLQTGSLIRRRQQGHEKVPQKLAFPKLVLFGHACVCVNLCLGFSRPAACLARQHLKVPHRRCTPFLGSSVRGNLSDELRLITVHPE